MKRCIYLDHNATTPLHPEVKKAMEPYFCKLYGNASSVHFKGREAKGAVDNAREITGSFLGTESVDIIFTSGGTESDNMAIKGVVYANREKKDHIITSQIEHPAVLSTCKYLEKTGFHVTYLPVDKFGMVNPDDVENAITEKTCLVTIMHANNEVGTIQPIAEIGKITREKGVYFHTDAVQSFGKLLINVREMNIDLLSISAHKIYGPKGVGALFVRKGVKLTPHQHGGHQERRLRGGTENVPGIVGLGKVVELCRANMTEQAEEIKDLRERLYEGLKSQIDHLHLNGHPVQRLPGTLNMGFEFIEGESIVLNLDLKGICASTGSACTSGSLEPSHVLIAMGVPPAVAQGSVRFSLGMDNTEKDIDYVIKVLPKIVKKLRAMSPLT